MSELTQDQRDRIARLEADIRGLTYLGFQYDITKMERDLHTKIDAIKAEPYAPPHKADLARQNDASASNHAQGSGLDP